MAFTFGATPNTTQTPAFGGFGTTTTSAPSTGLFGSTFGATGTTASGTTGGFSFGNLGGATSSAAPSFGGFGTTATTASTGFGAANKPTFGLGTGTSGFGSGLGTGTNTGFGGGLGTGTSTVFGGGLGTGTTTGFGGGLGTGTNTGFGGLGTGTNTGFGGGLGTGTNTGFGTGTLGTGTTFGGFGTTGNTGGIFGNKFGQQQPQQQTAQQTTAQELENLGTAITLPQIYGDERDAIIAKWNQLQAYWGTGKGYYSQNGCVTFTPNNPYCKFKAVGYSCIPTAKDEDGLVALMINKKESDVTAGQQLIVDTLFKLVGSSPQYSVCVEGILPLPDDKTEMIIYILERPERGPARRVSATKTFEVLTQQNIKQQLQTQANVENIVPKTGFTEGQLKQYLEDTPSGIHPLLWEQAKLDNPDPKNLIPVPMVGFKELYQRMKHQDQQTKLHQQKLDIIASEITDLQHKQVNMAAKLEEYKRKHLELGHRLLQVVVKQEIVRKMGYAIQADEEQLRVQLEKIQAELNHPTQFKGRLNEIMSQIRMQNHLAGGRSDISYQIDPALQDEMKQLLREQQEGLRHLIQIIKEDEHDLKLVEQSLGDSSQRR